MLSLKIIQHNTPLKTSQVIRSGIMKGVDFRMENSKGWR